MEVIDYFESDDRERWLSQIKKSDWGVGQFLFELLSEGRFFDAVGENSTVLLLTEDTELVAFCTLAEKDDIQPTELKPWAGFVFTFPKYRGRRLAGELLHEAGRCAAAQGYSRLYISTNHTGLYEKYGYWLMAEMPDMDGEPSRVYAKDI